MNREEKIKFLRDSADSNERVANEYAAQAEAYEAAGIDSSFERTMEARHLTNAAVLVDHAMRLACEPEPLVLEPCPHGAAPGEEE